MKSTLFATFLLCWLGSAPAMAQCNLHTKTDDFTGTTNTWTDKIKMTKSGTPLLVKSASDDDCTYRIYFRLLSGKGKLVLWLSEDADYCSCRIQSVEFKFENGSVLTKANSRSGPAEKTTLGEEQHIFFDITKEELAMLAGNSIEKFRIKEPGCADHLFIAEELDNKTARKIKEVSTCLLRRIEGK